MTMRMIWSATRKNTEADRHHDEHHGGGDQRLAPRRPGDLVGLGAHLLQELERAELGHGGYGSWRFQIGTRRPTFEDGIGGRSLFWGKVRRGSPLPGRRRWRLTIVALPRRQDDRNFQRRFKRFQPGSEGSCEAPHPEYWQEWRDSNPQPPVLETGALAIELHSCGAAGLPASVYFEAAPRTRRFVAASPAGPDRRGRLSPAPPRPPCHRPAPR